MEIWLHRTMSAALVIAAYLAATPSSGETVISSLDLQGPFHTRSHWVFTARQGPEVEDPVYGDGNKVPGAVTLCLSRNAGKTCDPAVTGAFPNAEAGDIYAESHFLLDVRVEQAGASGRPVLLVRTGKLLTMNGDQGVRTQLLTYDRVNDAFSMAYDHATGHNNNQEVRYLTSGRLMGDVISVEPTDDRPYGYWVTVNRLDDGGVYRQILRFRSATHYGDGNPLAVIDAEMPNIEKRLGVWRAGQPLPLPAGKCAKPHLVKTVLWCQ